MNFASDNTAGVAPAILAAIARAGEGYAIGYGDDAVTRRVEQRLAQVFEREMAAFLVPTGTAANALALAHLAPPWGAVLCHPESHIAVDECGASEFFGGGLKLSGLPVHMDGARFANALVRTNASPSELTWKAGVDVLSFGATKGGALAAEAVIFFDPSRAAGMPERRKRGGHLLSKHRFLAAQIEAYLADDLWLDLARHANRMADRLAAGLAAHGIKPVWPVEANEVFVPLDAKTDQRLKGASATYYPWSSGSLPAAAVIAPGEMVVRLVTSFATTKADVDTFVRLAHPG